MAKAKGPDPLATYREKRDPKTTNEPFGQAGYEGGTRVGAFVVHLHGARREHYDLRIQIGGTLLSFAVPRGPSLNPADKRLAVQTENHPLAYLEFEDVIPDGNYGAGPMIVWDTGVVRYLEDTVEGGLAKGKIDLWLEGYKLKGRFALVETGQRQVPPPKQRQWLLLKKADASCQEADITAQQPYSVLSSLRVEQLLTRSAIAQALADCAKGLGALARALDASKLAPMLCASEGAGLSEADRLYELKLDGVRVIADRSGQDVSLRYRKQRAATAAFPEIVRAVRALAPERVVLDGEIVSFDDEGKPSFERLARRIHATRPRDVERLIRDVPVVYVVFDLLAIGDYDLTGLPLSVRKELLGSLLPGTGRLRVLAHIEAQGEPLYQLCQQAGLEGVVAKKVDSTYHPGPKRLTDWVKIKTERDAEFVIVGWERKRASRTLGALLLASYEGGRLVLRGKAGSGLSEATQTDLLERLRAIEVPSCPAEGELPAAPMERHFASPELVASVRYLGWSDSGSLRFPVFRGLRSDVDPEDCDARPGAASLERPLSAGDEAAESGEDAHESGGARGSVHSAAQERLAGRVALTNQQKVYWPDAGYTKGDLCEYYASVADALLPFLAGRPVVLVRYPDGIAGKSFFQWNAPKGTPPWMRTLRLPREDEERRGVTFLVDDADGLLHLANLGCIVIHVLSRREGSLESCDFITFDFDLGGQPFAHAVILALSLRELLEEVGLTGYPKTSGQSGLHVLAPLGPGVSFETARLLAELIGRLLCQRHPELATMERRVGARGGRVYVDTVQNGRSRTIVAPYSLRAAPRATVSTPLAWEELSLALDPSEFTLSTVPLRVAELGDPYATLLDAAVDIAEVVAYLGERAKR
ncbi:MAG: DNA ligase D [Polyangiaceae bacterium]|nr:DNA ligase D [Polyangiaceae bacterium]MCW5789081.1 DNA ligase D [Polyangiaceae bacterium]